MTSSIIKLFYSKRTLKRIQKKITSLGSNSSLNVNRFLSIKILLLIICFTLCFITFNFGSILAPIITIALYYVYDFLILDLQIKKRGNILEHDAIFFFEVLNLTLQGEKSLKLCLDITSNAIDSELSREVKYALKEVNLGKSLTEALENLMNRIPSKNVNNVILNIIEATVYGNSLTGTLENQIEYITDKRILDIKSKINKMPTKISIASVLIFIPIIILLILGPILINYLVK